jgi:hypothetical protein
MISGYLLYLLYWILMLITLPLRVLPDATLPSEFTGTIATASGYIMFMEDLVPMQNILQYLGLIVLFEVGILSWKLINWVLRRIPGQS